MTHARAFRRRSAGKGSPARPIQPPDPVRLAAVEAYLEFDRGGALRDVPPEGLPSPVDRRLYSQLLLGLVRHKRYLEAEVTRLSRGGARRPQRAVAALAMLGLFQLRFLSAVPAHAAVFETVQIAPRLGYGRAKGWVNGVLRTAQRELDSGAADPGTLPLAVRTSHPDWMVERWRERYGDDDCRAICEANNRFAGTTVRCEGRDVEGAAARLSAEGIAAEPHPRVRSALVVEQTGALLRSATFREGAVYVQDAASQLLTAWVAPLLEGWAIDGCAAPGGKLTQLLRAAPGTARLVGIDRHLERIGMIRENFDRLRQTPTPLLVADAERLPLQPGSPGTILLDVPCMSTGMIRKYPELKWRKRPSDIAAYAEAQRAMLAEAARLLKPGGCILYSTCSLEPEENEGQIAAFLEVHRGFQRVSFGGLAPPAVLAGQAEAQITERGDFQTLPGADWMGLYGAILRKRAE